MHNARKYNTQITIGAVPSQGDLLQLQALRYRTLVDLRDVDEKFGGQVKGWCFDLGLRYVDIPIQRTAITIENTVRFYSTVFAPDASPLYLFSRFGKRPLALMLLFEAVLRNEPLVRLYQNAAAFGLNLEGDLCLRSFLVEFYNNKELVPIVRRFALSRPDLFALPP